MNFHRKSLQTLQPYNQWSPDGAESEGDGESGCDGDGLVYDPQDYEQDSDVDEWFDNFLKSSSNLGSEADAPKALPDKVEPDECTRPVARPLQRSMTTGPSSGSDVLMIEESPVKVEVLGEDDKNPSNDTKAKKVEQIAQLREHLKTLELQMAKAAWGAYL